MQASSYHHGDRVRPSETLSHLSGRTKPEREARNRVITPQIVPRGRASRRTPTDPQKKKKEGSDDPPIGR